MYIRINFRNAITNNNQVGGNYVRVDLIRVAFIRSTIGARVDVFDNQVVLANDVVLGPLRRVPCIRRRENLLPWSEPPAHTISTAVKHHLLAFNGGHVSGSHTLSVSGLCKQCRH